MSPALLAGLLAAASLAPFLNKAISGDSIFYLRVARQMLVSPLRPFDFTLVVDHAARSGWAVANNPPLVSGWYALLMAVGGEREWWLHLGALVFPALAAAGMARLARALWPEVSRGWAVAAGLLLVWTPGVFVNSTDLLYDAAFLAAWVWATALHAEALVEGSRAKRLAAYGCVAAAGMIKSVAILLPPILWFHAWLRHRSLREELFGTLIPLAVWLAWAGQNLAIYGQVQLLKARAEVGASLRLHKEVSLLCALGGATVFLPALLAAAARRSKAGWL
ncbi:MAG: glycosyltransferase family 39 protein, partial [bacterium]